MLKDCTCIYMLLVKTIRNEISVSNVLYRWRPRTGSTRRQSAGGKIRCSLQRHGLRAPQTLLKGFLRGLPGRSQLSQLRLPFRGQGPAPLPAVSSDSIDRKTTLPNQRQGSCGRRLVNANCLRQFRRGQVRDRVEYLQRRVLRGVQTAVGEQFLIENGHGSGNLAHCRAVTRKRLQFHTFTPQVHYMHIHLLSRLSEREAKGQCFEQIGGKGGSRTLDPGIMSRAGDLNPDQRSYGPIHTVPALYQATAQRQSCAGNAYKHRDKVMPAI